MWSRPRIWNGAGMGASGVVSEHHRTRMGRHRGGVPLNRWCLYVMPFCNSLSVVVPAKAVGDAHISRISRDGAAGTIPPPAKRWGGWRGAEGDAPGGGRVWSGIAFARTIPPPL